MDVNLEHSGTSDHLEDKLHFCGTRDDVDQRKSTEDFLKAKESGGMPSTVESNAHEGATLPDVDTNTSCTTTTALFITSDQEDIDDDSQDALSVEVMCESVRDFNRKYHTTVKLSPTEFLAHTGNGSSESRTACPTVNERELTNEPKENSEDPEVMAAAGVERRNELNSREALQTKQPGVSECDLHCVSEEILGSESATAHNCVDESCWGAGRIPDDVTVNEVQSEYSEITFRCSEKLHESCDNEEKDLMVETLENIASSATNALDTTQVLPTDCNVALASNKYVTESPHWFVGSSNSLDSRPFPVDASQYPPIMSKAMAIHNVPYYLLVVPAFMVDPTSVPTVETSETEKLAESDAGPIHRPERASPSEEKPCSESTTVRVSPCPDSASSRSRIKVSRCLTPVQPLVGRRQQFVIVQGNNRGEGSCHFRDTRNKGLVTQQDSRAHSPIYLQGLRPQGLQRLRKHSNKTTSTATATHARSFSESVVRGIGKSPLTNIKQKGSSSHARTAADEDQDPLNTDIDTALPSEKSITMSQGEVSAAGKGTREKRKRIEDKEKKQRRDRKYDSEMKKGFEWLKQLLPESHKAGNRLSILNEATKFIESLQSKVRGLRGQQPEQTPNVAPTLMCDESLSPSHSHGSESDAVVPEAEQIGQCESLKSPVVATVPDDFTRNVAEECYSEERTEEMSHYGAQKKHETEERVRDQSHWGVQGGANQCGTPFIMNDSSTDNTPSPFFVVPSDLSPSALLSPIYLARSPGAFQEGHPEGVLNDQGAFFVSHQACSPEQALYLVPTSPVGPFIEEGSRRATTLLGVSYQAGHPKDVDTTYSYETAAILGSTICEERLSDLGLMLSPFQSPSRSENNSTAEDDQFDGLVLDRSENSLYSPARLAPSFVFESHSSGFTNVAASVEVSSGPTEKAKQKRGRKTRSNFSPITDERHLSDKTNTCTSQQVQETEVLKTEVRPLLDSTNQVISSPGSRRKRKQSQHNDWNREEELGNENVHPNLAKVQLTPPLPKRLPGRPRKPGKKRKAVSSRGMVTRRGTLRNASQQLKYK